MGSIIAFCLPCGKAGGLQILRCQGIKVTDYNFTLDALTLKPSDFCNVGVIYGSTRFFEHIGMHLVFDLISFQVKIVAKK